MISNTNLHSQAKTLKILYTATSVNHNDYFLFPVASNIVLMSDKAVLVDFGLTVQMTEDIYIPRELRGTEVRKNLTGCNFKHVVNA